MLCLNILTQSSKHSTVYIFISFFYMCMCLCACACICVFWLGGHTPQCLILTLGSVFKDHSWQQQGMRRIKPGSALCKVRTVHIVLSNSPISYIQKLGLRRIKSLQSHTNSEKITPKVFNSDLLTQLDGLQSQKLIHYLYFSFCKIKYFKMGISDYRFLLCQKLPMKFKSQESYHRIYLFSLYIRQIPQLCFHCP